MQYKPTFLFFLLLISLSLSHTGCAGYMAGTGIKHSLTPERNAILKEASPYLDTLSLTLDELSKTEKTDWVFSVGQVTQMILENNVDIKISYLNVDTARQDVTKEEAEFDPTFSYDMDYARSRTPANQSTTLTESLSWNPSVTQKLITGGTLVGSLAEARTGKKHAFAVDEDFTLTQPLLEGLGPGVTLADLRISRNNYTIAVWDLAQKIINQITTAQVAYWEILNAQETLKTKELAFRQAVDLVEQSKREVELGKRTYTDTLEAEATAASRREEVIQARNNLEDQADKLKELLNIMHGTAYWNTNIVLSDKIESNFEPAAVDVLESIQSAFKNRPDYQQAMEDLKNKKFSLRVAKNALLPDVSLTSKYGLNGAGNSSRDAFDTLDTGDYIDWSVGFTVTHPFLERSDWADYNQKKNELRGKELAIRGLQLRIIKEVRVAARAVTTAIERVKAAELAYKLQLEKLEVTQKSYHLGDATSFKLLQFQEDLENAGVSRIRAIIDYHQSLIRFWQTLGTTLKENRIEFTVD